MTSVPLSRETAIQARLDAANLSGVYVNERFNPEGRLLIMKSMNADEPMANVEGTSNPRDVLGSVLDRYPAAAALIANAPSDLAYLLAENESKQARIDKALALEGFQPESYGGAEEPVIYLSELYAALTNEGKTDAV